MRNLEWIPGSHTLFKNTGVFNIHLDEQSTTDTFSSLQYKGKRMYGREPVRLSIQESYALYMSARQFGYSSFCKQYFVFSF